MTIQPLIPDENASPLRTETHSDTAPSTTGQTYQLAIKNTAPQGYVMLYQSAEGKNAIYSNAWRVGKEMVAAKPDWNQTYDWQNGLSIGVSQAGTGKAQVAAPPASPDAAGVFRLHHAEPLALPAGLARPTAQFMPKLHDLPYEQTFTLPNYYAAPPAPYATQPIQREAIGFGSMSVPDMLVQEIPPTGDGEKI